MRRLLIAGAYAALFAAAAPITPAFAEEDRVYTGRFSNLAVGGYDPVSYFEGAGVPGDKAFSTEYEGAVFRFASEENLARFEADAEAYAPEYGGYCAWAMADGQLAPGNPEYAAVHEGKLYLNANGAIQEMWNADRDGFIEKAMAHWPAILSR